jgi:hypothetical protein
MENSKIYIYKSTKYTFQNDRKIEDAIDFYNRKKLIGKPLKIIIEEEYAKIGSSTGITRQAAEKSIITRIKEKIFYTTYKFQLFDIGEVLYANDSAEIFFSKSILFIKLY